ncbi:MULTISPECIES: response regulator [Devosia]|uniref:response regulator n=1 Tax=Devosia TaxID=46913 RepID=UPI000CE97FEE|nr:MULTISPECIES: response regulator [Devosia]AVF02689.1 two-component system response regulator [Devosia sp. I507]
MNEAWDRTKRTILCIEDETHLRRDLVEELAAAGYAVQEAADGREALRQLDTKRPDLILCDISMPHIDGFTFLDTVRTKRPDLADVPLVFLTALDERQAVIAGKLAGADDYLVKPIDYDLLLATIKARLGQVERMDEKAARHIADLRRALGGPEAKLRPGIERILDMLAFGVVVASRSGITFANQAAMEMADAGCGLVSGRTLRAGSSVLNSELKALIESACAAAADGEDFVASHSVSRPSSAQDLLLTVCSLPEPQVSVSSEKLAVVFISDPTRRPDVSNAVLSDLFGLTPTEAEVARALAGGRRTDEIARDLAISATTVAFHLRNLFGKTGTHRQADLVALILTGLASISPAQTAFNRTGSS